MLNTKTILVFIASAIGLFFLLIFLFQASGMDRTFGSFQRNLAQKVLSGKIGTSGMIRFRETNNNKGDVAADIEMLMLRRSPAQPQGIPVSGIMIDSWVYGCLPFLFLLSLILATPLPWKNRLKSLLLGIILFFVFLLFKMWSHSLHGAIKQGWMDSAFLVKIKTAFEFIANHAGFTFLVAIIIWGIVAEGKKSLMP